MKKINRHLGTMLGILGSMSVHQSIKAAGFEIKTWSPESLGQANAGSVAQYGSVEHINRNPALLGQMNRYQAAASVAGVFPSIKFKNADSTLVGTTTAIEGGNGGNGGKNAAVPALYLGLPYGEKLKFGLSATVPWGLKTSYASGWVGRYWNLDSSMKTVNINPAVAYKINEQWAVGAGLQIQQMDVKLTRAINTTAVLDAAITASGEPAPTQAELRAQAARSGLELSGNDTNDIGASFKGDGWDAGATAGITYQPFKTTRLGLSWRSQVKQNIRGTKAFNIPDATTAKLDAFAGGGGLALVTALTPSLRKASIKSSISTPDSVFFGASQDITPEWTVLGEVTWTHWALVKEIRIKTTSVAGVADDVTPFRWKDTVAGSLGVAWRPPHHRWKGWKGWTFRTGLAYDPTPVPTKHRLPAVPDGDRFWVAAGAGYEYEDAWKFSLSYAHEFIKDVDSALKPDATDLNAIRGDLSGKYREFVDIVAAQVVYKF